MELKLVDVEETAFIPLSSRARETKGKCPRIQDQKAVEIIDSLHLEVKQYDKLVTRECVIARTMMIDEAVKDLIGKSANVVCINLGCGLDDRYCRVDNGSLKWFDVDLPNSIEVRKKVFSETERRRMISGNVLETAWVEAVQSHLANREEKIIVIAEGLFMYFTKEEHRKILQILTDSFPTGFLVVELMNPSMMNEKKHPTVKKTNAKFGWGSHCAKELEKLEGRMHLVSEKSISKQMLQSKLVSKLLGFLLQKINNRIAVFQWYEERNFLNSKKG